jgi:hypothetical protein
MAKAAKLVAEVSHMFGDTSRLLHAVGGYERDLHDLETFR